MCELILQVLRAAKFQYNSDHSWNLQKTTTYKAKQNQLQRF